MPSTKRLRIGIAHGNFTDLPRWSTGWQPEDKEYFRALKRSGFEAVQGGASIGPERDGLKIFGAGVVRRAGDAQTFAAHWKKRGAVAASCIAGFGYESDVEADAIVAAIASAADREELPIYIETHRASITQDVWRCLRLLERNPALRLNGDFSHWYTGLEMAAMDMQEHMRRLAPVFAKVHMLHGRIGDAGCMQVELEDEHDPLTVPFRLMWCAVMDAFARSDNEREDLWFFPELLGTEYKYARVFEGKEECDRWQQALLLAQIAAECGHESGLQVSFEPRGRAVSVFTPSSHKF